MALTLLHADEISFLRSPCFENNRFIAEKRTDIEVILRGLILKPNKDNKQLDLLIFYLFIK